MSITKQQASQQCMHSTGGSLHVYRQFAWVETGSVRIDESLAAFVA